MTLDELAQKATARPWRHRLLEGKFPIPQWTVEAHEPTPSGKTYITFMSQESGGAEDDAALLVLAVNNIEALAAALRSMLVTYEHEHWDIPGKKYCDRCLTNEQAETALAALEPPA